MNTQQFISDLNVAVQESGEVQGAIAKRLGLSQGYFSRLLKGKKIPKLPTVIVLWPFIYGAPFPDGREPARETQDA